MEVQFHEGISEVIATTRNGQPNAAPMGVINRAPFTLPFTKTVTPF